MNLYYTPEPLLQVGTTCFLDDKNSHHCLQVLRKKKGDQILLTNGFGVKATAHLFDTNNKKCALEIVHLQTDERPQSHYAIGVSLLKNADRIEWLLEKICEMGVAEIFLMQCDRTEKLGMKEARLQQILISAMLQSQQFFLPTLHPIQTFDQVIFNTQHYTQKYIPHCEQDDEKQHLNQQQIDVNQKSIFLIGPEGDFSPEEIKKAKAANFLPIGLGKNRLRTETAGLLLASYYYALLT